MAEPSQESYTGVVAVVKTTAPTETASLIEESRPHPVRVTSTEELFTPSHAVSGTTSPIDAMNTTSTN